MFVLTIHLQKNIKRPYTVLQLNICGGHESILVHVGPVALAAFPWKLRCSMLQPEPQDLLHFLKCISCLHLVAPKLSSVFL